MEVTVDPNLGCCGDATSELQQLRRKVYVWVMDIVATDRIKLMDGYLKLGYSKEADKEAIFMKEFVRFLAYVLFVKSKMICEDKCWQEVTSGKYIKKWLYRFVCLGIDVSCVLRWANIYYVECEIQALPITTITETNPSTNVNLY